MEKLIDARGMQCPLPVIETKSAMEAMTEAGKITVIVDNEIAVQNVEKLAKQKGVSTEAITISKDEYRVMLEINELVIEHRNKQKEIMIQNEAKNAKEENKIQESDTTLEESKQNEKHNEEEKLSNQQLDEMLPNNKESKKKTVVVITSNAMGSGDDKLGKTLMKGFLFALTKQDTLPDTILFYNSGAFLVANDSESLEDLKSLEAEGVEIQTCGACLDFYELKDKLGVGSITNMYVITETMLNAGLIIRP